MSILQARGVDAICKLAITSTSFRHFAGRTHGMEGAHKRQRRTSDLVAGDEGEAGAKRQRVQNGVAAAGRKGQATQKA